MSVAAILIEITVISYLYYCYCLLKYLCAVNLALYLSLVSMHNI